MHLFHIFLYRLNKQVYRNNQEENEINITYFRNFSKTRRVDMKRVFTLFLALIVVCSCIFANGAQENSGKVRVGISMFVMDAGMTNLVSIMRPILEEAGYEVFVTSVDSQMSKQVSDIEDLVTRGCKIIWAQGYDKDAITGAFEYAIDNGVMIAASGETSTDAYTYMYFNSSNEETGLIQTEWFTENYLSKNPDHTYKIAICNGTLSTSGGLGRYNGVLHGLEDCGYENFEIVTTQDCNYITETAQAWAEGLMISHPEVDVIFCANDDMALGVTNAIDAVGRTGEIIVLGTDGMDVGLTLIDEGKMDFTVKLNVSAIGSGMAQSMIDCLNGTLEIGPDKTVYGNPDLLYSRVDKTNYTDFI